MKDDFEKLCFLAKVSLLQKFDAAICFVWFHQQVLGFAEIDIKTINDYFVKAHLSAFPSTRLKDHLTKSHKTTKGVDRGSYKLSRKCLEELNEKYLNKFQEEEISIKERAKLSEAPFLTSDDISNAHKMAELYIISYCYENSVRRFIEHVLLSGIGTKWWDSVSNKELKEKYNNRKSKEDREKWVSSRGAGSPLYYLDWTDLVKIIRKEESRFVPFVNDIKWVEIRFEELERIRNVVAHNGELVSDDEFERIILYFKDWCKQVSTPVAAVSAT